jgi:hypothetical protein
VSALAPSVTLVEALPLVAVCAARVADDANLRLLLIKGPPATDLGVRANRPSVDVDVWVDPAREHEYVALLAGHGWEKAPGPPPGVGWGHAITLGHPDWPTTIDVHHAFPGFLAEDATVFEEMWQRRRMVIVADRTLATPDRVAAAAITILHALRSTVITETNEDHDRALATAAGFSDDERRSLQHLAERTGSAGTLDALLRAAGVKEAGEIADREKLEEWNQRTDIQGQALAGWLLAIRRAPWSRRFGLVLAALRPTDRDRANATAARATQAGTIRAASYRYRRALTAVFEAIRRRLQKHS